MRTFDQLKITNDQFLSDVVTSAQDDVTQYNPWRAHIYAVMEGGSYFGSQDWNDLLAYMDSEHKKIISLSEQVRQLEIALRIKSEEHNCCAEDLAVYRHVEDKEGWSLCRYDKQHGWIPVSWHEAVKTAKVGDGDTATRTAT